MTKSAMPKTKAPKEPGARSAPKGRNKPAQGNAPPEAQSPEGARQMNDLTAELETGEHLLSRILNKRRQMWSGRGKYKEPAAPDTSNLPPLPEGSVWATWDQIGLSQNGRPFPSAEYQTTGFKLLRPGNLNVSGKVVWTESNTRCMPQRFADENPDLIVRGRELVMNLTAQSLKDEFLGRVCITSPDEVCLLNQRLARLTPIIILPEFVLYLLRAPQFRRFVDGLNSGSLIQHMFTSQLAQFAFPLPPLADQRRIVAEIEKQFTRLEAGVAALRRVQANLKRYRAAVLKAACEGRLVPTEAERALAEGRPFESGQQLLARILTERRQNWQGRGKYKEPEGLAASAMPELPNGWTWATVEQLAAPEPNSITDGPFGSNLKTEHYTSSGPRVIRLQNIGDGVYVDAEAHITPERYERLKKHRIFANDVVIAGFGENPPRSCVIPESLGPAIVKADCIRFKPNSDVLPKYMNAALNSDPVRKRTKGMVHGVGRPRLNLGEIKSIVLPIPPLAEQTRIVAEVELRLSVVEELEAVVTTNLQRATRLRQSILQKAFTGELV